MQSKSTTNFFKIKRKQLKKKKRQTEKYNKIYSPRLTGHGPEVVVDIIANFFLKQSTLKLHRKTQAYKHTKRSNLRIESERKRRHYRKWLSARNSTIIFFTCERKSSLSLRSRTFLQNWDVAIWFSHSYGRPDKKFRPKTSGVENECKICKFKTWRKRDLIFLFFHPATPRRFSILFCRN